MAAEKLTDAELDKRVEAALERLSQRQAREDAEPDPPPTYDAFVVRSELTGAQVIGPLDSRKDAERERDRLNGDAGRVVGVNRRAQNVYAGGEVGRVTTYKVYPVEVLDRRAQADRLEEHVAEITFRLKRQSGLADGERETLEAERDELERQIAGLRDA